jgi:hypothetical protein
MYQKLITRANPGCIILLVDRSDSMNRPWTGSRLTLAQGAAQAINNNIEDLVLRCNIEPDEPEPRRYFDIGVFGYGKLTAKHGEGVESAFGGPLAGRGVVPVPEVANKPLAVRTEPSPDEGGLPITMPVWVEPVHGYRTPMCQALEVAGAHAFGWVGQHPHAFPPIVLNITDGVVTDEPHEGAGLADWAKRLTSIATSDGSALLFNIFLSNEKLPTVWFPTSPAGLPDPVGTRLWEISSELPAQLVEKARGQGLDVRPGARGMAMNADLAALGTFLYVGTPDAADD